MVIEYSDLPDDVARRRNPDGSLAIWAGSIAVHVFDVAFPRADGRPRPRPCLSTWRTRRWRTWTPRAGGSSREKPNAIKFERFIFDLMPSARNAIVVEVDPARAFAPLKNASGARPGHARVGPGPDGRPSIASGSSRRASRVADDVPVEISPRLAPGCRGAWPARSGRAAAHAAHVPPARVSRSRGPCQPMGFE